MVSQPADGLIFTLSPILTPSFRQDQPNGQIEEIENKMSDDEIEIDTELPCKIEPTESADLANNISKVNFSYFFSSESFSAEKNQRKILVELP